MLTALVIGLVLGAFGVGVGVGRRGGRKQLPAPGGRQGAIGQLPGTGGVVQVRGMVVATGGALTAPLTGRACVAYAVIAKTVAHDQIVANLQAGVKFSVHDQTGHALVQMDGTHITLTADYTETTSRWRAPSPRALAVLTRHLRADAGDITGVALELSEAILEIGAWVDVSGAAEREVDPHARQETGYRDELSTRLRFDSKPATGPAPRFEPSDLTAEPEPVPEPAPVAEPAADAEPGSK